jgi:hypothetical protein
MPSLTYPFCITTLFFLSLPPLNGLVAVPSEFLSFPEKHRARYLAMTTKLHVDDTDAEINEL